jgi:hypothetical protein
MGMVVFHSPKTSVESLALRGDIGYIPLHGGDFRYLALPMDLYSRRIVA